VTAPRTEPAAATPAAKPRGGASWGSRSFGRDSVKLKLVGSRRGDGLLLLAEVAIPAHYEFDIYARGGARTASGNLEGDFTALAGPDAETSGLRLRLSDGGEIAIELTDLDADMADFESRGDLPATLQADPRPA